MNPYKGLTNDRVPESGVAVRDSMAKGSRTRAGRTGP